MLKRCMLALAAIMITSGAMAQEDEGFEDRELLLIAGGRLDASEGSKPNTSIFIQPGYFVASNVAMGVLYSYSEEIFPFNQKMSIRSYGVFSRQYFPINDRLQITGQESLFIVDEIDDVLFISLLPGLNYRLTNSIALDLNIGGLNYAHGMKEEMGSAVSIAMDMANTTFGINLLL